MAGAHDWLQPVLERTVTGARATPAGDLSHPLSALVERIGSAIATLLADVVSQGLALANVLSLLAITPLVAFYLLRDWPLIIAEIDSWLPRAHAETVREQAHEIDVVLAGFARGAAIVCVALSAFYAVALSVVRLDFALVIGVTAGALSFVPYLGFAIGLASSVGIALWQFWPDWLRVALVLVIFLVGQVLSDYVLTPRLVGERTGLHPLWVIFGVFAGGALFGFVGMLLAVPACAAIGVLARFAVARYKESETYRGRGTS
jgi:predicted PurR-regulated permease PerM